ncbi:hypothetical protein [Nocardioides sp. GY 10127]|uniref:hypothetical protein n=1 Tax=Nocardioides sp. GY 10127 TaxID=2569762 RepID=UPI0010A7E430|nr:hypothetical protein [Nocardioides sp. GY 10127]TIC86363.1 hypothetical protein E8D37_00140 [Nocardioides sp. GY 10127]
MEIWSVAVALVGAVTGIAALVTQIWTHALAGPRLRVTLSNSLPIYPDREGHWVLGLDASNVGRLPVTITSYGLVFRHEGEWRKIPGFQPASAQLQGPRGAHRVQDAENVTWLLEPVPFARTLAEHGAHDAYGYVSLATGRMIRSRKAINVVHLASIDV